MPVNKDELISVAHQLAEEKNLEATICESLKGGCYAGGGAVVGGLLGGPPGLAIGGIIGSLVGYYQGRGKYESVATIILQLDSNQKAKLATSLQRALEGFRVEDVAMLLSLALGNTEVQKLMLVEMSKFLKNEMGLAITSV